MGFSHLTKKDYFLFEKTRVLLGEEKFKSYRKGLIFPYLFLGTLMICMTIVEMMKILQTPTFIALYIILCIIPIIMFIVNNKKNTGQYCFGYKIFKQSSNVILFFYSTNGCFSQIEQLLLRHCSFYS